MSKISALIRTVVLVTFVVASAFLCGIRLLQIQLVDGEMYLNITNRTYPSYQEIQAARGQIVDSSGRVLNTNKTIFNIDFQRSSLVEGTENDVIFRVLTVLMKNGEEWNETLPITKTKPYSFIEGKERAVQTMKSKLNIAEYATVENCIYQLYDIYKISDKYNEEMRRAIAGVRYEMTLKDFSNNNKFVMATDIGLDTLTELKELANYLPGVDITESWERLYLESDTASHVRGTIGAISAEEYAKLKDKGYNLNDIIGTSGVEQAMESELRGQRGTREITRGSDGLQIDDKVVKEPKAGNSVMLTLNSNLQKLVQQALEHDIEFQRSTYYKKENETPEGLAKAAFAGSVVVLDVKTGGVMAMASYPNFDINEYVEDYDKVISMDFSPVFNRALDGVYRPGSTFKTITATAGLSERVIDPSTHVNCYGVYTYFSPGYTPTCMGNHGLMDVRYALRKSCNIFFYETARRMGIEKLAEWAGKFGVGQDLGFELPMQKGQMTSLELFEKLGLTWNPGDIVQAGIGQSETSLTPLHLAVQAMTLANKGVRYEPHIVKSVYNYDFTEKLYDIEPVVAEDFSDYPNMEETMINVREGMKMVVDEYSVKLTNKNPLNYVGVGDHSAALKTGSPQTAEDIFNAAIIGYYPADDPEIAFGIMIEQGYQAIWLACNIVSAYANGTVIMSKDENGVPTYRF